MSRLDIAAERFETALRSLEDVAGPLAGLRREVQDGESRIRKLSLERERLLARVAQIEEESRALCGITEEVEHRLDGAIGEIRAALGR